MAKHHEEIDRLLSTEDVCELLGWTRQHIAREEKAGRFPKRIQIGVNTVRWSDAEIRAWLDEKKTARAAA